MSSRSIRSRITILFTLTLFISVLSVSGIIYYLLANSLRKSDHEFIISRTRDYIHTYKEAGPEALKHLIEEQRKNDDDQEMYVSLVTDEKKEIFTYVPEYLDKDHEDEEEIRQIYHDVRNMPLKKGWHIVLLLSGDEDNNIFKRAEYSLRKFVAEKKWDNILPLIDNDNVEVYFRKIDKHHWIQVGKSSEDREEHLTRIRNISLLVILPFLFIGFLVSFFLSHQILKPIKGLVETIHAILGGNKEARAKIKGTKDEVDQLSEQFNTLMDSNQNLIKSLKFSLDNVAHDLRTPVTRFRINAEEALQGKKEIEELKEALSEGVEASDRIMALLSAILDETEAQSGTMTLHKEKIEVDDFFQQMQDLYQFVAEEKNIILNLDIPPHLEVEGDRIRLGRVFGNLIDNAIKYSLPGKAVTIKASKLGSELLVEITDEGVGIPADDLNRIWERLYRVDHSRSTPGLGIGLSVVHAIVKAHGGEIKVASVLNQGSTFSVLLPNCSEILVMNNP